MFPTDAIQAAQATVYEAMPPTPQFAWPLLSQRLGCTLWVKHENHTPTGAFKVRGGLTYLKHLRAHAPHVQGVISATRGNHGQSIGFAARRHGLHATIVVPHGNAVEKNAAMRALGVHLLEHGDDFQAAREHAQQLATAQQLHMIPSYHPDLVLGVMTYWIEFFQSFPQGQAPDVAFVPIGMGSGFCAAAAARAYTGVRTRLVGVVSAHATAYLDSFRAQRVIEAPVSTVLADGLACRSPDAQALAIILREADDVVAVTDAEVAQAIRVLLSDTHNLAEGAGAASLAAAMQQRARWQGKTVATTLCGGNIDSQVLQQVLAAA